MAARDMEAAVERTCLDSALNDEEEWYVRRRPNCVIVTSNSPLVGEDQFGKKNTGSRES